MMLKKILSILFTIVCTVGAGLCVVMLVRAVQSLEWGRVVLYSVCLAVCVEVVFLLLSNLKGSKEE